jgi:hypothetical protein
MTRLSFETTRCAGRRDLTPDTEICPMRNGCLRYLTAVVGDYGPDTPMQRWLCELPRFEQRIAPPAGLAAADAQALAAWREIRGVVGADAPAAAPTTQGEPDHDNNDCVRAC